MKRSWSKHGGESVQKYRGVGTKMERSRSKNGKESVQKWREVGPIMIHPQKILSHLIVSEELLIARFYYIFLAVNIFSLSEFSQLIVLLFSF